MVDADKEPYPQDFSEPWIGNLTYKGNSVTWWHSKAENYKAALGRAWNALIANGINPDGLMDVAGGIHKLAQRPTDVAVESGLTREKIARAIAGAIAKRNGHVLEDWLNEQRYDEADAVLATRAESGLREVPTREEIARELFQKTMLSQRGANTAADVLLAILAKAGKQGEGDREG